MTPAGQPHPQDVLYLVNETLIAAIGEWDKGPHDINRILQLLRACPAHTSAPPPALESVPEVSTCNHSACRVYGPCIDAYEDYEAPPCAKYQTKEHNTAIRAEAAKAAREQAETTDNILTVLKKRYRKEMAIVDYIEMIECEVESLRSQQEPQQ